MDAEFPFRLRLHPRHLIDIGWSDLLAAARFPAHDLVEASPTLAWSSGRTALLCLSERTGFDALLQALDLPPDGEIVMSAVNVSGMAEIARAHGLTIRPVDLSLATLTPPAELVAEAITSRTALVLIAQLYGAAHDLSDIAEVCRERGVLLVEDAAQAWSDEFRGSPEADVSLFSFGPIKTSTALGGGVVVAADRGLAVRVADVLASHRALPDRWFRSRLMKYAAFKTAGNPIAYSALVQALRATGRDPDAVIGGSARGFAAGPMLGQIRRAPPARLALLMERRLAAPTAAPVRMARAAALTAHLRRREISGQEASRHAWWLTPVLSSCPDRLIADLRRAGFDATRGTTSLRTIGSGELPEARRLLAQVVYLPALSPLRSSDLEGLADTVNASTA